MPLPTEHQQIAAELSESFRRPSGAGPARLVHILKRAEADDISRMVPGWVQMTFRTGEQSHSLEGTEAMSPSRRVVFVEDESSTVSCLARGLSMPLLTVFMNDATRVTRAVVRIAGFAAVFLAFVLCVSGCERSSETPDAKAAPGESAKPGVVSETDVPEQPNIIFVLVDALRADKVGRYGRVPSITPTIDAVADEGVVFERPIAQAPWTLPSMASLFSAYNPTVHQVFHFPDETAESGSKVAILSEKFETLAELLQKAGYTTAAFVANPWMVRKYGFAQGFDHFDASLANPTDLKPGKDLNELALSWLRKRDPSEPLFLYLHYMDVHEPYDAGPEFVDDLLDLVERDPRKTLVTPTSRHRLGSLNKLPKHCPNPEKHRRLTRFREYWAARYEAGVREFDHHFASLRASLGELGLWDDAYVIVTADHGEALGEHELWSHGYSAHHTDLHVPLILRWPGELPSGLWVSGNVRLIDLMPTLLDQLSIEIPPGIQGESLVPLLNGVPLRERPAAMAEGVKYAPYQQALYYKESKLILTLDNGRRQLYNIYEDPFEQLDLAQEMPEQLDLLGQILEKQADANGQLALGHFAPQQDVSPEELERLKTLGYIGD